MTLQTDLAEAEAARHKLLIGQSVTVRGHGDRRIEYAPADLGKLDAYIADLRRQISGVSRGRNRVRYVVPG